MKGKKINNYKEFNEYMIDRKDVTIHKFMNYILICDMEYEEGEEKPLIFLNSFGYEINKAVLKAEKIHVQGIHVQGSRVPTKLLGLRLAAVCNIITNAIFREKSFRLHDEWKGGKVGLSNIHLDSDHLEFGSFILKNYILTTLKSLNYTTKYSNKSVIISYDPDKDLPEIKVDFKDVHAMLIIMLC